MNSDSDIWASSDDDQNYDRVIAEKDWERLQENHGNDGYKEGIIEGKEVRMQKGFDQGYIEGLALGKQLGYLRGKLSTFLTFYKQMQPNEAIAEDLQALFDELDQVDVQHLFSTEYFDSTKTTAADYKSPQDKIRQWEQRINQAIKRTAVDGGLTSASTVTAVTY